MAYNPNCSIVMDILIRARANPEAKQRGAGGRPLHSLLAHNPDLCIDAVRSLVGRYGADVNVRAESNTLLFGTIMSAARMAVRCGSKSILLNELASMEGSTPL